MNTTLKAYDEAGDVIEIVPYETLNEETRKLVDGDVQKLKQMQDSDVMQYGWDIQSSKNDILNNVISDFETLSVKDIDEILDDIMNSRKSVTPRKRTLLRKEYMPTSTDKKKFAGKVGDLEDAIKMQIQRILTNNDNCVRLIYECKNIIDRYAISIMAIEKYLAEKQDSFLEDVLQKKKVSLLNSRIANLQSAIMYMTLYKNNGLLVNRLYEMINVNLHHLQEQVLLQSEIDDIKKALGQCERIKDSIANLTTSNLKELTSTTGMFLAANNEEAKSEDAEKLMKQMTDGLRALSSRETKNLEEEKADKIVVASPQELGLEGLNKKVAKKQTTKDLKDFILIDAESLSMEDRFMQHNPKNFRERKTKELIKEAIQKGVKNFYKPKGDVSFTVDGRDICYKPGEKPAIGKTYEWYAKVAKKFYPERNSRLGSKLEYGAFLGVLIKRLVKEGKPVYWAWKAVCSDSRELGCYCDPKNVMRDFEPTGSREICGFCDLANTFKILAWDTEAYGFWRVGGSCGVDSTDYPLANFYLGSNRNAIRCHAVCWLVLS